MADPRGPFPQPLPAPAPAGTAAGANCGTGSPPSLGLRAGPACAAGGERGFGDVGCRGVGGSQGHTDRGRRAGAGGGEEVAVPPGRGFLDAQRGGCRLPAAWRGGDLGGLGVSAACLPWL